MAANQSKPWFEANKPIYERELLSPARALAEEVAAELASRDLPLTGSAKQSVFRIYRDVRFSKDKAPYKTHLGMSWMRPGFKKESAGIVYLHIADEGCFTAAGFYGLERPQLDAIRTEIRYHSESFFAAISKATASGLEFEAADSMTRPPRGFEDIEDPALLAAIKGRHRLVRRKLSKKDVGASNLTATILTITEAALPFLRFGWDAIEANGPAPEWSKLG